MGLLQARPANYWMSPNRTLDASAARHTSPELPLLSQQVHLRAQGSCIFMSYMRVWLTSALPPPSFHSSDDCCGVTAQGGAISVAVEADHDGDDLSLPMPSPRRWKHTKQAGPRTPSQHARGSGVQLPGRTKSFSQASHESCRLQTVR